MKIKSTIKILFGMFVIGISFLGLSFAACQDNMRTGTRADNPGNGLSNGNCWSNANISTEQRYNNQIPLTGGELFLKMINISRTSCNAGIIRQIQTKMQEVGGNCSTCIDGRAGSRMRSAIVECAILACTTPYSMPLNTSPLTCADSGTIVQNGSFKCCMPNLSAPTITVAGSICNGNCEINVHGHELTGVLVEIDFSNNSNQLNLRFPPTNVNPTATENGSSIISSAGFNNNPNQKKVTFNIVPTQNGPVTIVAPAGMMVLSGVSNGGTPTKSIVANITGFVDPNAENTGNNGSGLLSGLVAPTITVNGQVCNGNCSYTGTGDIEVFADYSRNDGDLVSSQTHPTIDNGIISGTPNFNSNTKILRFRVSPMDSGNAVTIQIPDGYVTANGQPIPGGNLSLSYGAGISNGPCSGNTAGLSGNCKVCDTGTMANSGHTKCVCNPDVACCGVQLNTVVPFIGDCIEMTTSNDVNSSNRDGTVTVNQLNAFPYLMQGLMKIVISLILIISIIMVIVAGLMMTGSIANNSRYSQGKKMIGNVIISLILLGASGLILKLINPSFFGG